MAAKKKAPGKKKTAPQAKKTLASAKKKGPRWRFLRVADATDPSKLGKAQREQLAVLATFYDGLATTLETLPQGLMSRWVRLGKVFDDGKHRFDLWSVGLDAGCLFWANSKEPVGVEIVQGGWGAYPKVGWVKRGLKLDLRHLAWDLEQHLGVRADPPAPRPEPAPEAAKPMKWKPRRKRKNDEDFEGAAF